MTAYNQRDLYIKLLQEDNTVQHINYTRDINVVIQNADNGNETDCDFNDFFNRYPSLLWYPNSISGRDKKNPTINLHSIFLMSISGLRVGPLKTATLAEPALATTQTT